MPIDLAELMAPAHTALVTQECQEGVIGSKSALPEMAAAVAEVGMIPNAIRLTQAARAAGVLVIHCVAHRRPDAKGANNNSRLFRYMAKAPVKLYPGSEATALVPGLGPEESDIVISRLHGLSPFHGTEVDWVLRNEGITTLVGVGVSANVAIPNLTFDAVNSGYQVVLPRDAIAGTPISYIDQILEHTLGNVATITDTETVAGIWESAS
jgi:nicotinamidase-related amidase